MAGGSKAFTFDADDDSSKSRIFVIEPRHGYTLNPNINININLDQDGSRNSPQDTGIPTRTNTNTNTSVNANANVNTGITQEAHKLWSITLPGKRSDRGSQRGQTTWQRQKQFKRINSVSSELIGGHSSFSEFADIENELTPLLSEPLVKDPQPNIREDLNRALSPRQLNMLSLAGVIGTGLYLSTSRALYVGVPAGLFIGYALMGGVVYLTLVSLGEMSTYMPISGSFAQYTKKFGSDPLAFALMWNYWFTDAVSVGSHLTALQLMLKYWETDYVEYWSVAMVFWILALVFNVFHVKIYGEAQYWLALLKITAILGFFVFAVLVNLGHNSDSSYVGFHNWGIADAPFPNGIRGCLAIFVGASFAYGGTASVTLTGGETENPLRNTPRMIKTVFWQILLFYIIATFLISMDVPYLYPNLANKETVTSPFTIVFQMAGGRILGSFMNAVIVIGVISACNHSVYSGGRVLYNIGLEKFAPSFCFPLTKTNEHKIPYVAVLCTWIVGSVCFTAPYIGPGRLWAWLQSIVGISNQIAWFCVSITSIRFRKGLKKQGKTDELHYINWTYPYGPYIVAGFLVLLFIVQGWHVWDVKDPSALIALYIELVVFMVMFVARRLYTGKRFVAYSEMDFVTDKYIPSEEMLELNRRLDSRLDNLTGWRRVRRVVTDYVAS